MTDINKVMDKIKKLLALAGNNPNQNEAESTLKKAQELMAKYNVEVNGDSENPVEYSWGTCVHSNNEGYRIRLGYIIAENFRCKMALAGNKVVFFGHKQDVEIAVEVFNYAYKVSHNKGLRIEREYRKNGMSTKGVANSYWLGFCAGIKAALDEQCVALMLVVPEDVKEKFSKSVGGKSKCRGTNMKGFDSSAYDEGFANGKDHMGTKKLK